MTNVSLELANAHGARIEGFCDARFTAVRDAFVANFVERDEIGACVAITENGVPVVDLWGGYRDGARRKPWQRDTIVITNSVTKEVIVVAMHMLVERGLIEIDAPVARYWPEFAANGKATLPVRYVLDHRAGLPIVEDAWPGLAYDWMRMTAALAAQRPMWPPGSTLCYHATTHGFLMGEIIRRVTGKLPGDFVRDEICTPFGIDWHLGLKPDEEARAAEFVASPTWRTMNADPQGMFARAWRIFPETELFNSTEWRRGQIPSAGGHGNARALARLAGILACGGELNGQRLLKPSTLDAAVVEQWDGLELVGRHLRLGLGFLLNCAGTPMGSNPRAFGMFGAGGHVAIADPDRRIGFAYNMNRMGVDSGFGPRAIALIEAALGRR